MCRWNQLDLAIVLLSIMGITLEEIEVNASLPINPTIIRIMRVLRIARGRNSQPPDLQPPTYSLVRSSVICLCNTSASPVVSPLCHFLYDRSQHGLGRGESLADGTDENSQLTNRNQRVKGGS